MRGAVLLLAVLSISTQAQAISEKAIYSRCYAQLTGNMVPFSDSLYKDVVAGKISGVDACKSLLHLADMDNSGNLKSTDSRGQLILNNMYQFHRTWFPTTKQEQILGYRGEFESNTYHFIDMSEPALYLTRNLFSNDSYRNVLSGKTRLEGKRTKDPSPKTRSISMLNADDTMVGPGELMVPFLFADSAGPINSINNSMNSLILGNYSIPGLGHVAKSATAMSAGAMTNIDFYDNNGGGIIGTRAFFMLNSGHPLGQIFNGQLKVPRKWAKTAMESMLCLNLPALRESDVLQYVDTTSTAPFRNSSSCLRCHASMDQAAYTARNLAVSSTVEDLYGPTSTLNTKSLMVGKFKTTAASVAGWPSAPVTNFQNQTPSGVLMYRSNADGTLIQTSVNDMEGLGQAMANTKDFYQCAAKRYFEYFTGISVSLYDRSDPSNAVLNKGLSTRDVADRAFIEQLGSELQSSQSLQKLIESIISSPYFKSANFSNTGQ